MNTSFALALSLFCAALISLSTALAQSATKGPGNYNQSIVVDSLTRTYQVHVPKSYASPRISTMPVVLAFHGGGGTAENMKNLTYMNVNSEYRNFIVVYPDGNGNQWNDGRPIVGYTPVDDVKFVRNLINQLAKDFRIDRKRVFATGISNGGFFAERLAFELSDQIAAVAPVVATMSIDQYAKPLPKKPISIMFILGTEDTLVPWNGGNAGYINGHSTGKRGVLIPAMAAVDYWKKIDHVYATPSVSWAPDKDTTDGSRAKYEKWLSNDNNEVSLITIVGGGHTWPGGIQYMPISVVGYTNRDISANEEIWQFFTRHPMK